MIIDKHWFAIFGMASSAINSIVYVRSILSGKIKPHVFSWFIWFLIMAIACAAQLVGHAGPGAWPIGFAALSCFTIACFSFARGEKAITATDWIAFTVALAAIPLWIATKNPLSAVILVTLIDALGFYPTYRKSWVNPRQENSFTFSFAGMIFVLSLFAMETYSLTTVLYPASLILTHWGLALMLIWRRRSISKISE